MSASLRSRSMRRPLKRPAACALTVAAKPAVSRGAVDLDLHVGRLAVDRRLDLRAAVLDALARDGDALARREPSRRVAPSFGTSKAQMIDLPSTAIEPCAMPSRSISMIVDSLDGVVERADRLERAVLRREVHRLGEGLRELRLLQLEPNAAARRGAERVRRDRRRRDEHAVAPPLPFSKRTSESSTRRRRPPAHRRRRPSRRPRSRLR